MNNFLRLLALALCLFLASCGSSNTEFVATGNSGGSSNNDEEVGTAELVVRSELVLAKGLTTSINTLTFTTFNKSGTKTLTSAPLPKAPEVKTTIPADTKLLQIDYKDSSGSTVSFWGSQVTVKKNDTLIINNPLVTELARLRSIEIIPPQPLTDGESIVDTKFRLPFRAEGTMDDNTKRDLTEQVGWSVSDTSLGTVSPDGQVIALVTQRLFHLTARLGQVTSAPIACYANSTAPGVGFGIARPSLPSSGVDVIYTTFAQPVQLELVATFQGQPTAFNDVEWSSSDTNVLEVDNRGKIRARDEGPATISATSPFGPVRTLTFQVRDGLQTNVIDRRTLAVNKVSSLQLVSGLQALPDLNKDGRLDLIAVNQGTDGPDLGTLVFCPGAGDGTFGGPLPLNLGLTSGAGAKVTMLAVDVNRDGVRDLVVASDRDNRLAIYRATTGGVSAPSFVTLSNPIETVVAGDLNGDGTNDLVVKDTLQSLFRLVSNGANLSAPAFFSVGTPTALALRAGDPIALGDVDFDGLADLAIFDRNTGRTGTLRLFRGASNLNFTNNGTRNFANPAYALGYTPPTPQGTRQRTGGFTLSAVRGSTPGSYQIEQLVEISTSVLNSVLTGLPAQPDFSLSSLTFSSGSIRRYATLHSGNVLPSVGESRLVEIGDFDSDDVDIKFSTGDVNGDGLDDAVGVQGTDASVILFGTN